MLNTVKGFENNKQSEIKIYNPPIVLFVSLLLIDFISIMILESQIAASEYNNWLFYTGVLTGSIATLIIITSYLQSMNTLIQKEG